MKKILSIAMILCLALCLASCGSESKTPEPSGQTDPTPAPSEKPYVFAVDSAGGYELALDADMKDVLAALGDPQSYFEAASCAFDGLDKTYTYPGFEITTRPDGEDDFVNSIVLTDDSVTTPEGIYIGCTPDDVKRVYGDGGSEFTGGIGYFSGGTILDFIIEDGKVVSIEYLKE
ncbi:MAG: hypothetical protein II971_07660 [Firmicutes bacterium]|nr:hypothetical protein [Bacillota bacterium]